MKIPQWGGELSVSPVRLNDIITQIPKYLHHKKNNTLVFQIPPEKVFKVCFWGSNTSSPGVWKPRDSKVSGANHS